DAGQYAATSPYLAAAGRAPIHFCGDIFAGHPGEQLIQRVAALAAALSGHRAQDQRAVFYCQLNPLAVTSVDCLCKSLRNAHRKTVPPFPELDDHAPSSDCRRYAVYTSNELAPQAAIATAGSG